MKIRLILFLIIVAYTLAAYNYFSPMQKVERLSNIEEGVEVKLVHKLIIVNSETLVADSLILKNKQDYNLNYQTGEIKFYANLDYVEINYSFYPEDLLSEYKLYEIVDFSDTLSIKENHRTSALYQTNTSLNITGSKTISVAVSNNQDFSVDQSLFLQLDGELGKNLNIEAQLTDSQSPITPEGDSREISSLDRVFIRLYGKPYELAFGDLEMEFSQTQFMNYTPSFEGLKASWLGDQKVTAALAVSKGKNKTVFISAIEGKQGPYYLSDNERGLQIIPGSEEVFLDGSKLQRGADYVIDYSEGSITFSNEFILTVNSFVQVTFQFSDEDFRQNMYLINSRITPWENFVISAGSIMQSDDKDSPLQEDFEDSDVDSLQEGGDSVIYGNGVVYSPDNGSYNLSEDGGYYVYDASGEGDYNIYFSFMGSGKGSYVKNEDSYSYVGSGNGDYLPVRELPSPIYKNNFDLNLKYNINTLAIESEFLATSFDQNTYSSKDDDDNEGYAYFSQASWMTEYEKFIPDLKLYYKGKTENLNAFSELNDPMYNYEMESIPDSVAYNEAGGVFRFNILQSIKPYWSVNRKKSNAFLDQKYSDLKLEISQGKYNPEVKFRWLDWSQDFTDYDVSMIKGENLEISAFYRIWLLKFELINQAKTRKKEYIYFPEDGQKTLLNSAAVEYDDKKSIAVKFQLENEVLDTLNLENNWEKYKSTRKLKTWWQLNSEKHSLSASYSRLSVEQDSIKHYDLAELKLRNSFLNDGLNVSSTYKLRNVEFYPKIRELVYDGFGILDSTGVPASDEDDAGYSYEVTDIDYENPKMSVEINANTGFYLTPSRFANGVWKRIRSETQLMITENSIFPDKLDLYLLRPDVIQNKDYTNYGRYRVEQSFWLDILPRIVSVDLSYLNEKTMDNRYSDDISLNSRINYMAGLNYNGLKKSKFKLEYNFENSTDSRYNEKSELQSGALEIRNRLSNFTNLKTSIGYFKEKGSEDGEANEYWLKGYLVQQSITHSLGKKYKFFANIKVRHNSRSGYGFTSSIDKTEGLILIWSAKVNYKVNSFTYAGLEYSGDDYSTREAQHKLKLEVKAEF